MFSLKSALLVAACGSLSAMAQLCTPRNATYDYIVVGGGTSGLVVASRLTEDPDIKVLVWNPPVELNSGFQCQLVFEDKPTQPLNPAKHELELEICVPGAVDWMVPMMHDGSDVRWE